MIIIKNIDNINFSYIKKNGLFLVCTSRFNAMPAYIMELLNRVGKVQFFKFIYFFF